jgi:outer membrane protein
MSRFFVISTVLLALAALHLPAVSEAPAHQALADIFVESAAFVAAEAEAPGAVTVSLDEAVARALERNGRLLAAAARVDAAESQVEQAKSAKRPSIRGQVQTAYLGALDQGVDTTPLADFVLDADSLQIGDSIIAGVISLQQVLYAGGSIRAGIEASEFLAESETWREAAARNDLVLEVKRAYYDCLLARALARVARESVETFERHREDAAKALEVGAVSRFEMIRAETELSSRRADLDTVKTMQAIAQLNLQRLLHWEEEAPIACDPALPISWEGDEGLDAIVASALTARPEIAALEAGLEAAKLQVTAREGQSKPRAAAMAQYQRIEGGSDALPNGLVLSVGLEWELYTGGRRKHEILEAGYQAESLEHELGELKRAVDLEVKQAAFRMDDAAGKIVQTHNTVLLAREGQELAELRFKQGIGTQTETLDADLALVQSRSALVQALRDYLAARAERDKAAGRGAGAL